MNEREVISFVGGGGKTSSIKTLANELKTCGLKVLITTSTMIFKPEEKDYDLLFLKDIPMNHFPKVGSITVFGQGLKDNKLVSNSIDKIDEIIERNIFDYILIESDGAKNKPIKAPAIHEPVISNSTTITIGVIGIDALHCEINEETVHRPEILRSILEVEENHKINQNDIVKLVQHPMGLFKSSKGKRILLLNKISNKNQIAIGKEIREKLTDSDIHIVIGTLLEKMYY